jgi:hypothetical protein
VSAGRYTHGLFHIASHIGKLTHPAHEETRVC